MEFTGEDEDEYGGQAAQNLNDLTDVGNQNRQEHAGNEPDQTDNDTPQFLAIGMAEIATTLQHACNRFSVIEKPEIQKKETIQKEKDND